MHSLFLVYFVKVHMFRAYLGPSSGGTTMYTTFGTYYSNQDNRQSSKKNNKYQLLNTYGCTSWWWA